MPRTFHLYPVHVSDQDLDAAVRAVWGEARSEGPIGEQAVAGVIRNRAMLTGQPILSVIKTGRFNGYNADALALPVNSRDYQAIRANIEGVLRGSETNPAGDATMYYNPGKVTPGWARQGPAQALGRHVFVDAPFPYRDSVKLPPAEPGTFGRPARPFPPPPPGPKPAETMPMQGQAQRRAAATLAPALDPSTVAAASPTSHMLGDAEPAGLAPNHAAALAALLKPMAAAAPPRVPQTTLAQALQSGASAAGGPAAGASVDLGLLARLLARPQAPSP